MFDRFASDEPPDVPDTDWDTLGPPDALDDEPVPPTDRDDLPPPAEDSAPEEWADRPDFSAASAASTLTLPGFDMAESDSLEPDSVVGAEPDRWELNWTVPQTARFFGQELTDSGLPIYTVNALVIDDSGDGLSAATLRVAQFEDLGSAQDFYAELQSKVGREVPVDEVPVFATYSAALDSHAAWQPIPIDDAYAIVEEMEAFDRDNPPTDFDLRPLMAGPEQVVYEACASSSENDQSGVFIGRFLMDGRHPEPLRTDYRLVGSYDSHVANEVVYGLQAIQSEMHALLDEDVSRADQAMLSAARDIAVDNGLIASDGHLFDSLPFDDRIPLDHLLQSLPINADFTRWAASDLSVPDAQQVGFALDLG